ncbi:MAG: hypothetical protein L3J32_01435, partial [Rhizobiaceae bacterium]|nr:hypothetical protein [Rhizobiaceae bacterium]
GHGFLFFLLLYIATPQIGILGGLVIFAVTALTAGFILTNFLRFSDAGRGASKDVFPGWEDYQ